MEQAVLIEMLHLEILVNNFRLKKRHFKLTESLLFCRIQLGVLKISWSVRDSYPNRILPEGANIRVVWPLILGKSDVSLVTVKLLKDSYSLCWAVIMSLLEISLFVERPEFINSL